MSRTIILTILLLISIILNIYFATQTFKFKKLYNQFMNSAQNKFHNLESKANNLDNKIKSYNKNNNQENK